MIKRVLKIFFFYSLNYPLRKIRADNFISPFKVFRKILITTIIQLQYLLRLMLTIIMQHKSLRISLLILKKMKFKLIARTINSRAIKNNNMLFFIIKHKQAIINKIQISDTIFFLSCFYIFFIFFIKL